METYSTFHFSGYSWNHHAGKISLRYALDDDVHFEELLFLPEPVTDERLKEKAWEIERLLLALHLVGGVSYYKTCLPKNIDITHDRLSLAEAKFWNTVYEQGLGEFFFRNDIDFRGLINFPALKEKVILPPALRKKAAINPLKRILVPIGGGKDSMVTVELLRKSGADLTLLRLQPHPLIDELSHIAGLPLMSVRRELSPTLFELNRQGALNGHVPITAYLSILSCLVAMLYDYDAVAMSNEGSANIGNVEYKGLHVNHQWSKSAAFERMLRRYLKETVGTDIEYFSALRPYSELKIAEMFTGYPRYARHTTSCNKNWKILSPPLPAAPQSRGEGPGVGAWCGICPKCAFVFATMAAFLPREALKQIFGSLFFDDKTLLPLFRELLGLENHKPFECVGTPEETSAALLLAHRRGDLDDTAVMKMFVREALPSINDPDALIASALKLQTEHFIPEPLQSCILHPKD